jgi:hypothetical protein
LDIFIPRTLPKAVKKQDLQSGLPHRRGRGYPWSNGKRKLTDDQDATEIGNFGGDGSVARGYAVAGRKLPGAAAALS